MSMVSAKYRPVLSIQLVSDMLHAAACSRCVCACSPALSLSLEEVTAAGSVDAHARTHTHTYTYIYGLVFKKVIN